MDNTQLRFSILGNAKKPKGKQFNMYKNISIGDDVTPHVRKELLGTRKCQVEKGVECLPPFICVKKKK